MAMNIKTLKKKLTFAPRFPDTHFLDLIKNKCLGIWVIKRFILILPPF